jgi:hypothetical protein
MIKTQSDCCTPDRRYMIIRGRLWRLSNPSLDPAEHERLVRELMNARRAVLYARESAERMAARQSVDAAKRALGERGAVWWDDGSPDYNRRLVVNTPYAAWFSNRAESSGRAQRLDRPETERAAAAQSFL